MGKMKALEERRGRPLNEISPTARAAARRGPLLVAGHGAPAMPLGLTPRMRTAWRHVVRDLTAANMLDRADWAVVEAFAVAVGRAREARAMLARDDSSVIAGMLHKTAQGLAAHPALGIEERAWKEVRQLAEQLPLSPWGRARLGVKLAGDVGDDMERELGPARLRAVTDG